ncbi:MAG: helix-hairpin-helix domain-containing protein [Gemmataceae bacterium]
MSATPLSPSNSHADSRSGERVLAAVAILSGLFLAFVAYSPRFTTRPLAYQPGEAKAYRVDLNRTDRAELLQIPGIGPGKADAILAQRKTSDFQSVDDLSRVKGVGIKTIDRLKPHVVVDGSTVLPNEPAPVVIPSPPVRTSDKHQSTEEPIDVNAASEQALMRLPGVGRVLAGRIKAARPFAKVEDLLRVKGIGAKTLEKLRDHVVVK